MSDLSAMIGQTGLERITVLQGEAHASTNPAIELSTVLGSCVATCLFDPTARIGGMNHFLLAEPPATKSREAFDEHYGLFLMELLINKMLGLGALKSRLKARLYGGANLHQGMSQIGSANAAFARRFLRDEGIPVAFEDMEGRAARRIHFMPASGMVRCRTAPLDMAPTDKPIARPQSASGDVELF